MIDYSKTRTDYDVVQSLKFYFMLSIQLISQEVSEKKATESMNKFIRDGKGNWWHSGKTLNEYYAQAYNTIPSEFLSRMEISTPGDRDTLKIVDSNYTYVG